MEISREKYFSILRIGLIMSLTLGLAPFVPEPHVWGKVKWFLGGAVGMKPMDWFDLLLHGLPWVFFLVSLGYGIATGKFKKSS